MKYINIYYFNIILKLYAIKYLFIFFQIVFANNYQTKYYYFSSEIRLVINGTGEQKILNSSFNSEPSKVIVNGIVKESCKKSCIFENEINNVTLYYNDSITSCDYMFSELNNIIEIDLSNFDFSYVKTMIGMFRYCMELKAVNLGDINSPSLTRSEDLFFHCEKLESINILNFNTCSVTIMCHIFFHCYSLKSIVFPEAFDTSNVVNMDAMFSHCKSLISLNLSSFDTSKVTRFCFMFNNCFNLKYLNISNFSSDVLKDMNLTFYNLASLIYLNIYNLEINSDIFMTNTFYLPTTSSYKICANKTNMKNNLSKYPNIINNCSDICFIKNIKIDIYSDECIKSCKVNGYTHEYGNICYNECPENTYALSKDFNNEFDDNVTKCLDRNPEGYFLDIDLIYKKCFENCLFCYGEGNEKDNNCSICKKNYLFINDSVYKNNCYKKCENYYYFNESNDYICTENCSGIYDKLIPEKNKCINKCENDDIYKYEYNQICYSKCPNGTIYNDEYGICLEEKLTDTFNSITNFIIEGNNEEIYQGVINNILLNYDMDNEKEIILKGEDNFLFQITNTESDLELLKEKNNRTNQFSVIDLGQCDNLLKNYYKINKNISLIIIKFEKIANISSERFLQYEIYEPYNKTKLNLSICSNITIDIYTPLILSDKLQNLYEELKDIGYDLFDINGPFYQDICTPYKSNNGTDVSLTDRINYFYNNEETTCQYNCKFSNYLMETQYLKCDCDIKNSEININNNNKFNPKSIYESFYSILNIQIIKF